MSELELMFDRIFEEVMHELGINAWYILFDSDAFELVEERISNQLGYDCWECAEFIFWHRDMAEDL